jgi:septum site-determining protein MinC
MISIKGLREGLLVICDDEPWLSQLRELEGKLNANARFFKGGQIALDVKSAELTTDDLQRTLALFHQYGVTLWAVLSQNERTNGNIRQLGLASSLAMPARSPEQVDGSEPEESANGKDAGEGTEGTDGLLVRRRVRAGQVLRHPGHIVVIGDVNPGAQLIAGGDIIVWGKLQGVAHAGALGDSSAVICALELVPSLLRIADAARGVTVGQKRARVKRPEMAVLEQQEITIVAWQEK